jgi:uncharacterized integral membrane protein
MSDQEPRPEPPEEPGPGAMTRFGQGFLRGIGIAAFALFVAFALANMHRVEFSWLLGRSEILEVAGETTGGVPLIVLLGAAFVLGIILGWALTSARARARRRGR